MKLMMSENIVKARGKMTLLEVSRILFIEEVIFLFLFIFLVFVLTRQWQTCMTNI